MDKDSAKKTKGLSSPALKRSRELNAGTSEQSAVPRKSSRTTVNKMKASLKSQTLIYLERLIKRRNQTTSEDVVVRQAKRKFRDDGEGPQKEEKRSRFDEKESASTSADSESCNTSVEDVSKRGDKRKDVTDGEGPNRKKFVCLALKAKYLQLDKLGEGGCGSVFAGYRKADYLPVAIKHIPNDNVHCKHVGDDGKELSAEVVVMLKLAAESKGTSAPVSLLDWYDLDQELILVMERPIPAEDLYDYIRVNGGSLDEEEAKIILKQLVEAAIYLEKTHIFHRDIKIENVLIESSSDVLRVRLIDFGLSCFGEREDSYHTFYGTNIPPEWFNHGIYRAGPTTVFQIAVVLFETVHRDVQFDTVRFYKGKLRINNELSQNCQDLLRTCLKVNPDHRPTLTQLMSHPWLQ